MFISQNSEISQKSEIRKIILKLRNEINPQIRKIKDEQITFRFMEFVEQRKIRSILLYASYGSEVDCWRIFHQCKEKSIRTSFPKVNEKEKILEIYWVENLNQISPGYKSIPEPHDGLRASIEEIDLIAVPGVAFDLNCNRIGYGGGFYDRLLLFKKGLAIGLAYEEQIVEKIPVEPFDIRVDLIITDERVISCV